MHCERMFETSQDGVQTHANSLMPPFDVLFAWSYHSVFVLLAFHACCSSLLESTLSDCFNIYSLYTNQAHTASNLGT